MSAKPARPVPSTRPPLERMVRIHDRLAANQPVNCTSLARDLEVSTKTVMRDLDFMRDRFHLPIAYDATTRAFRYTEHVEAFPTVQVTEGEVFALLVAQRAVEQYRGTPFHDQLASAFDKLSRGLSDTITFTAASANEAISFSNVGTAPGDPAVFEVLSRCVMKRHEARFQYRKPDGAATENRRVHPYHLAHRNGIWYMIGFDVDRGALRQFAVPRIEGPKQLATTFVRPADFDPKKHFHSAFGATVGEPKQAVRIRFDSVAAPYIQERDWHPTQVLETQADGTLLLRMTVGDLEEVERWVTGWGRHAEVLEPAVLRRMVREAGEAIVRNNRDRPRTVDVRIG